MSSQSLIVCLILITALGQRVFAQDVSARAANPDQPRINADPDAGLGGKARNMYTQKLSGHRMMHFGKRPQVAEVPMVAAYRPVASVSDEEIKAAVRRQHLMEIVSNLLEISRRKDNDEQEQKQKRLNNPRALAKQQQPTNPPPVFALMRLVQEGGDNAFGIESGNLYNIEGKRKKPTITLDDPDEIIDLDRHLAAEAIGAQLMRSQNLVEAKAANDEQATAQQQQQQQQQATDENINVAGRSLPVSNGGEMPNWTKAQISNLLWGRAQPGQARNSILSGGTYIKKTEPQRMTFMHFG